MIQTMERCPENRDSKKARWTLACHHASSRKNSYSTCLPKAFKEQLLQRSQSEATGPRGSSTSDSLLTADLSSGFFDVTYLMCASMEMAWQLSLWDELVHLSVIICIEFCPQPWLFVALFKVPTITSDDTTLHQMKYSGQAAQLWMSLITTLRRWISVIQSYMRPHHHHIHTNSTQYITI